MSGHTLFAEQRLVGSSNSKNGSYCVLSNLSNYESPSALQGEWRRGERNGRGHFVFGPRPSSELATATVAAVTSALPTAAVCSGIWIMGKVKKGTEVVRFVNGDGEVEVASVEEGEDSGGDEDSSGSDAVSVASRANKSLKRFFRSIVRR
jgi:hypothetical protein